MSFPYKKNYLELDRADVFRNLILIDVEQELLKKYDKFPKKFLGLLKDIDTKFNGQYWILEHEFPTHYVNYNVLSDYYIEELRMKVPVKPNSVSPFEYFQRNKNKILKLNSLYERREYIYKHVREASQFKPTVAKFIYEYFNATKILDPCVGWGDRLLAALSIDVEYWGIEPDEKLHPHYNKMINDFTYNYKNYHIAKMRFENSRKLLKTEYETFDMCLASPPYFDYENYDTMSVYKSEEEWLDIFMYPTIDIIHDCLKDDGILALHLSDNKYFTLTRIIYDYCLTKFKYIGCIYSSEANAYPKPVWIFTK